MFIVHSINDHRHPELDVPPITTTTNTTTCEIIKQQKKDFDLESNSATSNIIPSNIISSSSSSPILTSDNNISDMLTFRRRRIFHRHACLISVMAAFTFGLVLGILLPLFGYYSNNIDGSSSTNSISLSNSLINSDSSSQFSHHLRNINETIVAIKTQSQLLNNKNSNRSHQMPHFPTIDDIRNENTIAAIQRESEDTAIYNSVSFVKTEVEETEIESNDIDQGSYNRLPNQDLWVKNAKRKPNHTNKYLKHRQHEEEQEIINTDYYSRNTKNPTTDGSNTIIQNDIYWGPLIENNLPTGFTKTDAKRWQLYLNHTEVTKLELGCGRMQNRLIHFRDGGMACARYRQNTDQLQGELFSFYLGQLLNLTNLVPSIATVLDPDNRFWSSATEDIADAQWRKGRPVILTKWLSNLEPAGIPKQFQPLERHLNKFDVKNMTIGMRGLKPISKLFERLGIHQEINPKGTAYNNVNLIPRLVELAQWSDLIVFDYLIANLDRVVNNLYNHQW